MSFIASIFAVITSIGITISSLFGGKPATPTQKITEATPTAIFAATPSATPVAAVTVMPKAITEDCVGPDGKHLSLTKTECDKFNSAWHPNPTATPTPSSRLINQAQYDSANAAAQKNAQDLIKQAQGLQGSTSHDLFNSLTQP
jgi:hypothetical protein